MIPLRIAYGYPTAETMQKAMRNEVFLGGCIIRERRPTKACPECGSAFDLAPGYVVG